MRNQPKVKIKNDEAAELRTQLARALADYDNLTKRVERERADLGKLVSLSLVSKLLSVLDTIESAQKHLNDQGLSLAISEFKKVLSEEGLEEIMPEVGSKFDSKFHEGVESLPGNTQGEIAEIVLPGWKFSGGSIIRVAKVKVFGGKI